MHKNQQIQPIAKVVSPYREKFGIPRQPGLVEAATGYLHMLPAFSDPLAFDGIDGFSHLWVIFGFHACAGEWRKRVRPPRLGGNQEVGVFASRSPFRPNNLGLSVLHFTGLQTIDGELRVGVSGLDLLHGTPVYDIKPYLAYTDSLPNAQSGFAQTAPTAVFPVSFTEHVDVQLRGKTELRRLITQILQLDPRPAYQSKQANGRVYGIRLDHYNVRWQVQGGRIVVVDLSRL